MQIPDERSVRPNSNRPLRVMEQTISSRTTVTPIKYDLASFSMFMKCPEVMKTPPNRNNVT